MAVDREKIIQSIIESSRIRDSKGVLPCFGVYFSFFFAQYYTILSSKFKKEYKLNGKEGAEHKLVCLAQHSAYLTFQRVCSSWEWKEIAEPELESKEDQLEALLAVAMALGWGDIELRKLIPEQELVVRVNDSSEANTYLGESGLANRPQCHMLQGVMGALMDLLYGQEYPHGCYTFSTLERFCRARGDAYCEFISRTSRTFAWQAENLRDNQ